MNADPATFRFVSTNRRVREDRRFVAGHGHFVADVALEGMLHVAILPSQHPAARIVSIDASAALAMPGVHYVLTGDELAAATDPLMNGLDTPKVRRHPLAVGRTRYSGEWVVAVVADTRALAEDATEKIRVIYELLPFVTNAEEALLPDSPPVHPEHGSNVLLDRTFVWGDVEKHFAESPRHLSFRVTWGRSSTVPIETFGVAASWDPWREILDVWASIQMPKYPDQIARALRIPANGVRVHQDVDVGGSYGVKRGIKQTVLVAHLARRLGRPVRLIEDRLENMSGGDAHGPDRIFDVDVAFNDDGIVKSMKIRALDNAGAYAGRAPFQLGKPIGAIVGPYQIESVQYRAQSVTTNKAVQEAVRGFGQAPTNYAIETAIDKVAAAVGLERIEVRRRNFIRREQFPYLIPERQHLRQRRLSHRRRQGVGAYRFCRRWKKSAIDCAAPGYWPASASRRAWSQAAPTLRSSRCSMKRIPPPPGWIPAASSSTRSVSSPSPSTTRRRGRDTKPWSQR